jgi:hypothetical protein
MYIRLLRKATHTKKFTISHHQPFGWEVHEEEDSRVIVSVRYRDWHRVERAMRAFANKAESLCEHGWSDYSINNAGALAMSRDAQLR